MSISRMYPGEPTHLEDPFDWCIRLLAHSRRLRLQSHTKNRLFSFLLLRAKTLHDFHRLCAFASEWDYQRDLIKRFETYLGLDRSALEPFSARFSAHFGIRIDPDFR